MAKRKFALSKPEDACTACPYNTGVKIYGRGDTSAKIMVIYEAPSNADVSKRELMSSGAMKYFLEEFKKVGGDKNQLYFKTIVQCLPPLDEDTGKQKSPERVAIECCSDFLTAEIEAVKPTTLLLLGSTPLRVILGKKNLTRSRGAEYMVGGYSFKLKAIPTYHPSAVLSVPEYAELFKSDLKFALDRCQTSEVQDPLASGQYIVCSTMEKVKSVMDLLKVVPEFTFDIETHGLRPDNATDILAIGFAWKEDMGVCIPIYHPESPFNTQEIEQIIAWLKEVLENPKTSKIAHNGKFDAKFLSVEFGIDVQNFNFDTMLASYLLNEGTGTNKLKDLAATLVGMPGYSSPLEEFIENNHIATYRDVPLRILAPYCAADASATLKVKRVQEKIVDKTLLSFLMKVSRALLGMETTGLKLDTKYIAELQADYLIKLQKLDHKLKTFAGNPNFNVDSTSDLKELLYDKLKLPVIKKTKTGSPSTDKETLEKLKGQHPCIDWISDYRDYKKTDSTYLIPALRLMAPDGRLYCEFLIHGTATGRLSSKDPNLQNIPTKSLIKNIFVAEPGNLFIQADYSQAELRVLAMASKDPTMIKAFQNTDGPDFHTVTACNMFKVSPGSVTKEMRRAAKAINFGIVYGMGPESLAEGIKVPVDQAIRFIKTYFDTYPGVKRWMRQTIQFARQTGYVESLFHRKRRLDFEGDNGAERKAINTPIQSAAADFTLLAILRILELITQKYPRDSVRLCVTVHDSILLEVREDLVNDVAALVKQVMYFPEPELYGFDIDMAGVPLKADIEVGRSWGELVSEDTWNLWNIDSSKFGHEVSKFEVWVKNTKSHWKTLKSAEPSTVEYDEWIHTQKDLWIPANYPCPFESWIKTNGATSE